MPRRVGLSRSAPPGRLLPSWRRRLSGLKVKRLVWTIVFLGITLAAIVMEVVAGVWHPAGTIPWTEYISQYVPWPVQLAAYVTLAVWLPFHFWRADAKRKAAYREGYRAAQSEQVRLLRQMREEGHADGYLKALQDHDVPIPQGVDLLPEVSVQRGGIKFGPPDGH